MLIAVTRAVSPAIVNCELTHLAREPIDVKQAVAEHAVYEDALRSLGATIVHAPPEPALPDAVFVEDTALVFGETAVLTRPGAASRRREVESMATVLREYRALQQIQAPGNLDGGDVLVVDRKVYVGLSSRSNREGITQLETLLSDWDYEVTPVPMKDCLHLKSAVTQVAEDVLLINDQWVSPACFGSMRMVCVAPDEPHAANALWINGSVIYPAHHPNTAERLKRAGLRVVPVPAAELAKAEGGVTCCSVLVETA